MEIGIVGLGRMGGNMARRLRDNGHDVAGYDANPEKTRDLEANLKWCTWSLAELVDKLTPPRIVWMMVAAGETTDSVIADLKPHLSSGDILIDGGNANYKSSLGHFEVLAKDGIRFLDIGVSGGIWGLAEGYCLMVGGDKEAYLQIEPILKALASDSGYAHVGPSGAGHFSKMVHNGIEYAMLEAYGEGFELLNASSFDFDLEQVASLWLRGSVVRSWLLDLCKKVFAQDPKLAMVKGWVNDSGEGRWTVQEAMEKGVPVPAIADALFARYRSREEESFSAKVIAALRHEFGGHDIKKEEPFSSEADESERKAA